MSADIQALEKMISKAKMQLMMEKNSTFFSALLSSKRIIITDTVKCAATNGIWIKFNPGFLGLQNQAQTLGLMLHEVYHIVHEHIERCIAGDLDPVLHNIAGDHYNNLLLLAQGYELPEGGYHDPKYRGWSTMQIYNDLLKNPPPNKDQFVMDLVADCPDGMSPQEQHEVIISDILKAVMQAQANKDPGSIPQHILLKLEDVINPKLPWEVILQKYMDPYAKNDFSWSRPNRRYLPDNYLPSARSDQLIQVTSGVDVSGSMTTPILNDIIAQLRYIWASLEPLKLHMITFDTMVHMDKIYNQGEYLNDLQLVGGGGTNIQPLLDSVKKENPEVCLIFTDGYFNTPNYDGINRTDIIWIIYDNKNFTAPIGRVIYME